MLQCHKTSGMMYCCSGRRGMYPYEVIAWGYLGQQGQAGVRIHAAEVF